jgi:hypothetical protein
MGGLETTNTTQEQILDHNTTSTRADSKKILTSQNINTLMKLNIHTFGDIINLKDNTNQWFDEITLTKLGLKCLYQWTLIKKVPIGLTLLRQQSCWIRLEHNDIIEYLGQIAMKGT